MGVKARIKVKGGRMTDDTLQYTLARMRPRSGGTS